MLDLLIYKIPAKINAKTGKNEYIIAGRSCLAGDIFGEYKLANRLKVGSIIRFADAAGYTMVKKNWFNGLKMPSIVVKGLDGKVKIVKKFLYNDFLNDLSRIWNFIIYRHGRQMICHKYGVLSIGRAGKIQRQ
ncbi:MAG: hypothetical protein LE178_01700 [Endomicrobium sp.]|nr:hypothetical protein [Endomicrobium sp.]